MRREAREKTPEIMIKEVELGYGRMMCFQAGRTAAVMLIIKRRVKV